MSKSNKAEAVAAKNYTAEQEHEIISCSPVSYDDAVRLAEKFGKSAKSVIAKIHSLRAQGAAVEYTPKAKPAKRVAGATKAEIVSAIEARVNGAGLLKGLAKAPAADLAVLLDLLTPTS